MSIQHRGATPVPMQVFVELETAKVTLYNPDNRDEWIEGYTVEPTKFP